MRGGHVRIGILGGIGPEATGTFYLKLMRRLQELGCVSRSGDYPQVIVNSVPAHEFPERVDPSISIDDVDPMYSQGLLELDAAGVDFIAMACNTVHIFHRELQSRIRAPVIDLREAGGDGGAEPRGGAPRPRAPQRSPMRCTSSRRGVRGRVA